MASSKKVLTPCRIAANELQARFGPLGQVPRGPGGWHGSDSAKYSVDKYSMAGAMRCERCCLWALYFFHIMEAMVQEGLTHKPHLGSPSPGASHLKLRISENEKKGEAKAALLTEKYFILITTVTNE